MTADAERKIGQDLRALRERAGLTQGAAAIRLQVRLCGIPRSAAVKPEAALRRLPPDEVILPREIPGADEGETFRSGPGKAGLRRWRSPAFPLYALAITSLFFMKYSTPE